MIFLNELFLARGVQERITELEKDLQRVREEDVAAQNLFRCQQELHEARQDRERMAIDLEKAKKVRQVKHIIFLLSLRN
jgi:hypothetical protein